MLPPKAWKKCLHKNATENLDIMNYSIEENYRSSVLETLHKDGFLPSLKKYRHNKQPWWKRIGAQCLSSLFVLYFLKGFYGRHQMLTEINLTEDSVFFNRYKQNSDTPKHWDFCRRCRHLGVCSSPFYGLKCFPFMAKMQARTKTANRKCVIACINLELQDCPIIWSAAGKAKQKWLQNRIFRNLKDLWICPVYIFILHFVNV